MLAFTTLAGHFSAGWAVAAGLAGGLAFLLVVYTGLAIGMTRMNFLEVLGTMFSPSGAKTTVYGIGVSVHLMMSAAFGLADAALLHAIGVTTVGQGAGWGLLIGAGHGLVILAVFPTVLTAMHPLVRKQAMDSPGVALTGFGSGTPIGSLMAHAAFGVVTAAIYVATILR
jgi:hypothetical protein